MVSASEKSTFQLFKIIKNGKIIDLSENRPNNFSTTKVVSINYYESLFSPMTTATVSLVDNGGIVHYDRKYDRQERSGTIVSALPLAGDVEFQFKIASKYGILDFTKNYFVFDKQITPTSESNRQGVLINLVSNYGKLNLETEVKETYRGNISNSAKKILENYLQNPNVIIDNSKNSYNFSGENRDVFSVLLDLASKSIPPIGNPGYFFYQTQNGFNFRSVDQLLSQQPVATYYRTDVLRSNLDNDKNDFKILYKSDIKREDLITLLKSGVYRNKTIFFNPITLECEETENTLKLSKTLAKINEVPEVDSYTRTFFMVKDYGTLDPGVENLLNNDPKEWQAKSPMRYNSLFSQSIHIQVPCNVLLKVGDIINCRFEVITQGNKFEGVVDRTQSGKYLILNLCHHFDALRSYTSMVLVRDSYG